MPDVSHFKYPGDDNVYDVMDETARAGIDTLNTEVADKAPTNHASSATTYGRATGSLYGHAKVINNLTTSSHTNGYALSAYQGYLLKQAIPTALSQIVNDNNSAEMKGALANNTDLDTVLDPGIYLLTSGRTYTNAPPNSTWGLLVVFDDGDDYVNRVQMFFNNNSIPYTRMKLTNSWRTWRILLSPGAVSTPASATATYNGLTITFVRAAGTVHVSINGSLTADLATSGGYVVLCDIPSGFEPSAEEVHLFYGMLSALYYGQVNFTSSKNVVRLGYTRKIADASASAIPSGTSLYARFSYACDTV